MTGNGGNASGTGNASVAPGELPVSITCPVCGATSHNPNDAREGYCGRCHDWTGLPALDAPVMSAQERRDRELLARHLRALASAVNVADWPAYILSVAAGHETGRSWYRP